MLKFLAVFLALIGSLKADQQIFLKDALQGGPIFSYGTLRSSDSVTYSLNAVTKGVRSSAIDTAGYVGLAVKMTITAGSGDPIVIVETSNTPTAASFRQAYYIKGQGSGFIPTTTDRYFRFMNNSSLTYTAVSLSWLPVVPDSSNGQTQTINGTVTANQGNPGSVGWFIQLTTSPSVTQGGGYWGVSVTASPAYVSVSNPAYTVLSSTATTVNITSAAGTSANYDVWLSNNYGGAAIRYVFNMSATAPADLSTVGSYLAATSTTQILGTFAPGYHVHMYSIGTVATGNYVTVGMHRKGFNSANP